MYSGLSHIVRYEELWRDQVPGLLRLTKAIREVTPSSAERAVERCSIDSMRKKASGDERKFFRKGGSGGWREALAPAVKRILTEVEPYPSQCAALGYRMTDS
jgi:hypothetical protein